MDLVEIDVARMGRWASQRAWLHERTVETLGGLYDMHWPGKQPTTARGLRRLPLAAEHRAAGAAFGQVGGWERPLWFEPGVVDPEIRYSYTDPSWFPAVRDEVRATREGVALYDLTTYAKFLVAGPGALGGLQRLVTSDLDVAPGRIVYTVIANEARRHRARPDDHAPRRRHVPRPRADAHASAAARACSGTGCRPTRSSPT